MKRSRRSLLFLTAVLGVTAAGSAAGAPRRKPRPRPAPPQGEGFAWSQLEGRPTIAPGRGVGYFIFREGNVVSIITTNLGNRGRRFQASAILEGNGTLNNARSLKLERKQDVARQPSPTHINFQFMTYGATDGVQFTVNGGTRLRIRLELGQKRPEDVIFLGGAPAAGLGNPVIIELGA
jgi:hypothetical protein